MAEFTGSPASSTQYAAKHSVNRLSGGESQGVVHIARYSYTHTAGSGTGEINLVDLPPGRVVIYSDLSRLITSVMGVNADLHLGYRSHRREDGTAVPQDDNTFVDDLDTTGGIDEAFALPASGILELDSQGGVTIFMTINNGSILNGNTVSGWIAYSRI